MTSTASVNFSIRQNKAIEREIVFDGMRAIIDRLSLSRLAYVGFGSVWFSDFAMAHRQLGVEHMHSIESDPVVAKRANFNKPYRTVRVHAGMSSTVLPTLLARRDLKRRNWIVWLDYDKHLDVPKVNELVGLLSDLPPNSFLITTFAANPGGYGQLQDRLDFVGDIFGKQLDAVPAQVLKDPDSFGLWIANVLEDHLAHRAIRAGRPGGYVRAFKLAYRDGMPMVTVGGFLPSSDGEAIARSVCGAREWLGRPAKPITTAPLTPKEVAALQGKLPRSRRLTRADVQRLGFDLELDQIELFEDHYLRFPAFAQLMH